MRNNTSTTCLIDSVPPLHSSTRGGDSCRGNGSPGARLTGAHPDETDASGRTPEQEDGGAGKYCIGRYTSFVCPVVYSGFMRPSNETRAPVRCTHKLNLKMRITLEITVV